MTPPELLHTSGAGLIMYMFKVIAERIGLGINRDNIDTQHTRMQGCRKANVISLMVH